MNQNHKNQFKSKIELLPKKALRTSTIRDSITIAKIISAAYRDHVHQRLRNWARLRLEMYLKWTWNRDWNKHTVLKFHLLISIHSFRLLHHRWQNKSKTRKRRDKELWHHKDCLFNSHMKVIRLVWQLKFFLRNWFLIETRYTLEGINKRCNSSSNSSNRDKKATLSNLNIVLTDLILICQPDHQGNIELSFRRENCQSTLRFSQILIL